MSEEALQPAIRDVQDALSKYVKKPPLSEKFLKKPPFRYLHDIVNAVIRETGFLDGVFTGEELDSNNVKDKESKIAFLSKLISAVRTASGKSVAARPAKIAAGLEVEKTLELLRIIGQTIDNNKLNRTEADIPRTVPTKTQKKEAEDKPKEKIQNGHQREKAEKVEKVVRSEKAPPESTTQKRAATAEKSNQNRRTSIPRRESLKKDQRAESKREPKIDVDATRADRESKIKDGTSKVPPKDSKAASSVSKSSKENGISSRRSSIENKIAPGRKSSLKDSNRKVIDKKIRSVVIKEEKEEEPPPAVMVSDEKQATKSKKIKVVEKTGHESSETKKEVDEPSVPPKSSTVERNAIDETKSVVRGENSNDDPPTETNRSKESTTLQRPSSARPGSRKLPRTEATISNSNNDNAENGASKDSNSSANSNSEKMRSQLPTRPRTANRPPSARPGAPKIRDRGEIIVPEETNAVAAPVNVFEEGTQDQFVDDKDDIIIIEPEQPPAVTTEEQVQIDDAEQGQLVHQILKTQKELNDSVGDTLQNRHLEIEWEAGRQREKDVVTKETEKIRNVIQILTSAANPLGKLFDFLQEDVDEMQRELQHWKNVNEKVEKQQQVEQELKEQSLQPLRRQLQDVGASIEDEYRQIASIKTSILANDEKILKLISGPASHHQTRTRVK